MDREMKEREFQLRREEAERKRQDDQRRFEREERKEERRRQDEERRRQDEMGIGRRLDLFQQQLMQQNQMLLELLRNQRKE
ncbi:hypothetical protein HOLleu_20187 [Holothuria leucospilota]|uniref:Uncharacterized protein n=1 Tax=Holothuria leucospilota TaxID=206669 RepID=A0A9Q1C0D1_HOLLE|nr:hypothetical protein HOLleu_20187 [Holothuria leucospilota]